MSAIPNTSNLFYQTRLRRPMLDRADGIYLWDTTGKRYLDGSSGAMVSNIGHSNPAVLDAMKRQMDKSTFGYRLHFENEPAEQFATAIAKRMPQGLDRVFFVSGGSEAVESSIKIARQYAVAKGEASRWKVISRFPSYHGSTLGALALTGMSLMSAPFSPMMTEMPKIPAPTCYLDRDSLSHDERGLRYANMLREEILRQGPETVLAFIMEPVGGASTGALVAPDSYYPRIRDICDEFGILLIADEVMTGAGRTGAYLGVEHWNLRPDIIALSKGFGAGYAPLGAMVASHEIAETVIDAGGFIHGFTYAGNPLACAAGLAVLGEIDRLGLVKAAEVQGVALKAELAKMMNRYPFIGDVRGKGLLLAFELVSDRQTMEPLPVALNAHLRLVDIAYERGLIIYSRRTRGGRIGDHFLVCPPLITTPAQIGEIMEMLTASLDQFAKEAGLPVSGVFDMADPVIITCAITGSIHTPTMSPYLPVTPDEIVEQAVAAAEAGAAIIHLHARNPEIGIPSGDPALFMDFLPRIKARTNAVLNVSTGGSSRMTLDERLAPAKTASPEMCSLNMGSMNFGLFPMKDRYTDWKHDWEPTFLDATKDVIFKNTFRDIEGILDSLGEREGVRFEFEIYDVGHLQTLAFYIKKGLIKRPVFLQFVLGVLGGIDASPESLMNLKATADRLIGDYHFSVLAAGGRQFPLGTMGVILGGNVRVGLEDNLTLARGELATSNADQVSKMRRIIEELGHTVATPDEARRRLGLKGVANVRF